MAHRNTSAGEVTRHLTLPKKQHQGALQKPARLAARLCLHYIAGFCIFVKDSNNQNKIQYHYYDKPKHR